MAIKIMGHKPPPTAWVGMFIVVGFILMGIFAPWIAPYSQSDSIADPYSEPSAQLWFGADQIGRDLLSRVIYGARTTIGIAFVTTVLSFTIGIVFGLWAVVGGKVVDQILSRIVDVMLSIPLLIFALIILSLFGSLFTSVIGSLVVLIFVIAVL